MDEKIFKQIIQQDSVGLPDPSMEQKLQQTFMLRSAGYRVRQNSFSGFFGWLLAPRQVITKIAFAVITAAFFFMKPGLNTNQHLPAMTDSARVDQSRVQDSAWLQLPDKIGHDSIF